MADILVAFSRNEFEEPRRKSSNYDRLARGRNALPEVRTAKIPICSDDVELNGDIDARLDKAKKDAWRIVLRLIDENLINPANDRYRKLPKLRCWYIKKFLLWRARLPIQHKSISFGFADGDNILECPFRRGFPIAVSAIDSDVFHSLARKLPTPNDYLDDLIFSRYYSGYRTSALPDSAQYLPEFYILMEFLRNYRKKPTRKWKSFSPPNIRMPGLLNITVHARTTGDAGCMPRLIIRDIEMLAGMARPLTFNLTVQRDDYHFPVNLKLMFNLLQPGEKPEESHDGRVIFLTDDPGALPVDAEIDSPPLSRRISFAFLKSTAPPPDKSWSGGFQVVVRGGETHVRREEGGHISCPANSIAIWDGIWDCVTRIVQASGELNGKA